MRKTHEKFVEELRDRQIVVIGKYAGTKEKVMLGCKIKECGHIWNGRPDTVLGGCGCPECGKKRQREKVSIANLRANNIIKDHGDYVTIDISTSAYPDVVMDIDKKDLKLFKGRIFTGKRGYPLTHNVRGKIEYAHRVIEPDYNIIDHIDRNPFNNRRSNIRKCTKSQNAFNSKISSNNKSGVAGVRFVRNRWNARITVDGKGIHLGYFDSKKEASNARKEAEIKYCGEFA